MSSTHFLVSHMAVEVLSQHATIAIMAYSTTLNAFRYVRANSTLISHFVLPTKHSFCYRHIHL
jgi:hypothetical protein